MPLAPDWERGWWDAGYRSVCGVDEVGRGALAGPLVAVAVVLSPDIIASDAMPDVADSKTVRRDERGALASLVRGLAAGVGIGEVSAQEIDDVGLGPANRLAMLRAVAALPSWPDALLIDAMTLDVGLPQVGLVDGDARCLSIAAASIVAKVHRDHLMVELSAQHSPYGFERHVGYGTAAHLEALRMHGPCAAHRRSFAPVRRYCTP